MMQLVREHARSKSSFSCEEDFRIGLYLIREVLAVGATGTVRLAINSSTGAKAAVKIVDKTVSRKRKEARKEIKILQGINHEHIIALRSVEEDAKNLYLFLEYADQGDLYSYIQRHGSIDESLARNLFVQLVDAVEFCHCKMRIAHHDLKLENIVITSDFRVKLIDFGFAVHLDPSISSGLSSLSTNSTSPSTSPLSSSSSSVSSSVSSPISTSPFGKNNIRIFDGSPAYSAPEILLRRPHNESVDIFSLGVCLYYLLCGCFPFCDPSKTNLEELCHNIRIGFVEFPEGLLSVSVRDLLMKMLSRRKKRISLEQIKMHSWFLNHSSYSYY